LILLLFIVTGFTVALVAPRQGSYTTPTVCLCSDPETEELYEDGVRECSNWVEWKTIFRTYLLDIVGERTGTEMIECEDGEEIDKYIDWEDEWDYRIGFGWAPKLWM